MEMTLKPPRNYPLPPINPIYVFIAGSRINEAVSEEEALQLAHNASNAAASGRHGNTGPTQQEIMAQTAAMRQLAAKREGTKAWAVSAEMESRWCAGVLTVTYISAGKKRKTQGVGMSPFH